MEYSQIAVLFLILAIGALIAEVFLPSGGILSVVMLTCLGISVFCAWKAWWYDSPGTWWTYVAVLVAVIPGTFAIALYALPRTGFGKKVLLEAPELDTVTPYAAEAARLEKLVGRYGKAITPLNPGGLVRIDNERVHSISEGGVIDRDADVLVMAVRGTRLLVRATPPPADGHDVFLSDADGEGDAPLDFELPQG